MGNYSQRPGLSAVLIFRVTSARYCRWACPGESRDKDIKLRVYSKLGYGRAAKTAADKCYIDEDMF